MRSERRTTSSRGPSVAGGVTPAIASSYTCRTACYTPPSRDRDSCAGGRLASWLLSCAIHDHPEHQATYALRALGVRDLGLLRPHGLQPRDGERVRADRGAGIGVH